MENKKIVKTTPRWNRSIALSEDEQNRTNEVQEKTGCTLIDIFRAGLEFYEKENGRDK